MDFSPEEIAAQLRCPHGGSGALFGQTMNLRNLTQIVGAFSALHPENGDKILEIGCGNGGLLAYVLSQADDLHYTGLEISPLMQQEAEAFNTPFIAAGRAEYRLYGGGLLPFDDETFDKAVSVNTLYFWEDAQTMLAEICRVLKPAGRLCLNFCEKEFMSKLPFSRHGFTLYDAAEIRVLADMQPLHCTLEKHSRDWAVSKTGNLVRREYVDLVFEKH